MRISTIWVAEARYLRVASNRYATVGQASRLRKLAQTATITAEFEYFD